MAAVTPETVEYLEAHREIDNAEKAANEQVQAIGMHLLAEFNQAERDRQPTEQRWLRDLRQYKGKYDPDVENRIGPNRSKSFVRKTRVKVKTIDSRVADLLFPAGSEKNYEVTHSPKPTLDDRVVAQIKEQLAAAGAPPEQQVLDQAILERAKQASQKMAAVIDDQLTECRYKETSLKAVHSGHLYGTGILKGPLVERKVRTKFKQVAADGPAGFRWVPFEESYVVPFVDYVPIWRFYPDMSVSDLEDCGFVYERHTLAKHKMVELSKRNTFDKAKIIAYLKANPRGLNKVRDYDRVVRELGENNNIVTDERGQYEVLERWGWLSAEQVREAGVTVPKNREHETFFSNVWLLPNGTIIRCVLQPINGVTWPYRMYYFDKDETSIFGEGLPSIMRDDQEMLNAAVRMILDNAALTSGPQLEVQVDLLSGLENIDEIIPWKIWKRKPGKEGTPAIRAIEMPSRLQELTAMAQLFEANADEVTAIPRYMSGENATSGAAGTAAGMSMLMGAANIVIKDLITSWDEGVTRPFLQDLYRWNMRFHPDNSIKGDFDVKARGTASLVAREVRARQLNEFAAMTSDPADAPFIKRHNLLRQRAEALELSDVVKTEEEVKAEQQSEQAKAAQQMQMDLANAQVQEALAKAQKTAAEAELARGRAKELETQLTDRLAELKARTKSIEADTVKKITESIFAALQAGGVATNSPYVAPAGDEILRSAGFKDANGEPDIADLNGPPVQEEVGTQQLLNKGQAFVEQPRGVTTSDAPDPTAATPAVSPADGAPQPATGMVGKNAGIETTRIEGAA